MNKYVTTLMGVAGSNLFGLSIILLHPELFQIRDVFLHLRVLLWLGWLFVWIFIFPCLV